MKKGLQIALTLWVIAVVVLGLSYMVKLGNQIDGKGPQALTSDGANGFFMIAGDDILHFNADEKLLARKPFSEIGLSSANALLYRGSDASLLTYDNERHRIFRCQLPAWTCKGFSPESLEFTDFISMSWLASGDLVISDNTHHRLVTLSPRGNVLFEGESIWHFPNQVQAQPDGGLLLADTDRFAIIKLRNAKEKQGETVLKTATRPYQYLQLGDTWWVLQAGAQLESATLFKHAAGEATEIPLSAEDPVSLLHTGSRLIIASRQDWELLSLDPTTGNAVVSADAGFQKELTTRRLAMQEARKQRGRIPYLMALLLLPALGAGVVLQRKLDAEKAADVEFSPSKSHALSQTTSTTKPATANPRKNSVRIDTDSSGFLAQRQQQNAQLLKVGLIALPIALIFVALFWFLGPQNEGAIKGIGLFSGIIFGIPLLIYLINYLGARHHERLFDQHFICGPQKLVHIKQGKPVSATPYEKILLGDATLVLDKQRLPLYLGKGTRRKALWLMHDIQREIGSRIPPEQHFSTDLDMVRAVWKQQPGLAMNVLAAQFALAIVVIALVLLKILSLLDHLHLFTLWKIFKPD